MPKGLLTVGGTLDLSQFWPLGESDADTTKLLITVSAGAFQFQSSKSAAPQPTRAFDGAWVKGAGGKKAVIDKKNRITVRLQGIDAPELHYAPAPLTKKTGVTPEMRAALKAVNHKYRQHWGQSAAKALLDMLSTLGHGPLDCTFVTAADHPTDVCDKYGRCVGDVVVEAGGKKININRWVLAEGWAAPSFYNSMTKPEITVLAKLAAKAQAAGKGIWPDYSAKVGAFNFNLRYTAGKQTPGFETGDDRGALIMPKLYRRQTTWACYKKAGIAANTFAQYLKALNERFYLTADYLASGAGAPWQKLGAFVKASQFTLDPGAMVLEEAESTLYSAAGQPVTAW
jgi:endonuclease YncB( thermonuclease family)